MLKGSEEETRHRMMSRRLLLCIGFLSLLLPALLTAPERPYPKDMPMLGGKPMAFVKDRDGNVVDGSWEHLEKARERCAEKGRINVSVIFFHETYEEFKRQLAAFGGRKDIEAMRAGNARAKIRQSFAAEFAALQYQFIESIEAMGFEVDVTARAATSPGMYLWVDESLLEVLITHPMVRKMSDGGQSPARSSVRKYPPEMPATADGKALSFMKDREGNVVDGSRGHIERARKRCIAEGSISVEIVLFHEGYEQLEREGDLGRRVRGRRALESQFKALQDAFIGSIEEMGLEANVDFRSTLVPGLYLRVDENVLAVLVDHPMVARITDVGQIEGRYQILDSTPATH